MKTSDGQFILYEYQYNKGYSYQFFFVFFKRISLLI